MCPKSIIDIFDMIIAAWLGAAFSGMFLQQLSLLDRFVVFFLNSIIALFCYWIIHKCFSERNEIVESVKNETAKSNQIIINPNTRKLILSEVKKRLKTQIQFIDSFDNKAGVIITSSVVILGIVMGLNESFSINYAYYLSATLFFLSLIFAIGAYAPKKFFVEPNPKNLKERFLTKKCNVLEEKLIEIYTYSFERNEKTIACKNNLFLLSMICLVIGLVILFIGAAPIQTI